MRILWFAPEVPFVREYGGGIDIGTRVRSLHSAGHRITLAAFSGDELGPRDLERINECCSSFVAVERSPIGSAIRFWLPYAVGSRRLGRNRLHSLLQSPAPDIAIFESPIAAEAMAAVKRWRIPTLLRVHNLEARYARANAAAASSTASAFAHHVEAARLAPFERACFRRADAIAPLSLAECDFIARSTATPVTHVPIPVAIRHGAGRPIASTYVAFTGSMYLSVNAEAALWFLQHVWPRVKRAVPESVFAVVGRGPSADVVAAARRAGDVVVTGEVEDAQAYIAHAAAIVVPMFHGAGVKVKVIEALGHGRAIVATPEAVAGTAIRDGVHAVVRTEPEAFTTALVDILRRPEAYEAMRRSALDLFREHHDPEVVSRRFTSLVEATASVRPCR